jgi:uncharacterized membrane protein YjdF
MTRGWISIGALAPPALAAGLGIARGDRRVIAYVLVWGLLALLVRAVHRRWPLSPLALGALVGAGVVHLAGGLLPSPDSGAPILYETWLVPGALKFDQAAHAAISAVVAAVLFELLGHIVDPRQAGPAVRAMLALLATWGFGAANELFEFLSAARFPDAYVGDLSNAGWDLAFNTAGSAAAVVACAVLAGAGRQPNSAQRMSSRHASTAPATIR